MEDCEYLEVSATKLPRLDTDYAMCIVCQKKTEESLVTNPTSQKKLLEYICERASYYDSVYPEIQKRLENETVEALVSHRATWHRTCYQNTVHAGMCRRAKERFEKKLLAKGVSRPSSPSCSTFTRSQSAPYNKDTCFFCDGIGNKRHPLHKCETDKAGMDLKTAIDRSGNEKLLVKLSTAINPNDAHAIDVRYHKRCWTINVANILRKPLGDTTGVSRTAEAAADLEFMSLVENTLLEGSVLDMATIHEAYVNIQTANNIINPGCSRKKLKQLIESEISGVEFHKPKKASLPERVSLKNTRDAAIELAEQTVPDESADVSTLYDAAHILRREILKCENWTFKGSLTDIDENHVPKSLYSFYRWVLQGPVETVSTDKKAAEMNKHAMSLAQTTVSMCLTKRQVNNRRTKVQKYRREMPQQLAVGIAVRQAYRDKRIINLLHGFGISVEYNRLLRLETNLANGVLEKMMLNDGLYIPPDIVLGRHIYFAADNVDFAEDTPDGKNTLHATSIAVYQQKLPGDAQRNVELTVSTQKRSLRDLPPTITSLVECSLQKNVKPQSPIYPEFHLREHQVTATNATLDDMTWLWACTMVRVSIGQRQESIQVGAMDVDGSDEENEAAKKHKTNNQTQMSIPTWSAYNSLTNKLIPVTKVCTLPLIAAPAHEWQTLLTVLKQSQNITTHVVGPNRSTVISLDMGLYKPAKQLQMSRDDLNDIVLRPGELHIVMAMLRCMGSYIEGSGIDFCWTEAGLYGPATVKQILDGNHVKRGIDAHLTTLQALFALYEASFAWEHPDIQDQIAPISELLNIACEKGSEKEIQEAHMSLSEALKQLQVKHKMLEFDAKHASKPLFRVMCQYMQMVIEMLMFIRSVRTGNWELHLVSLQEFTKYFFAHDRLVYARMIPLYLADMESLKTSSEDIYEEFCQGNWVVNRNEDVPFCAIGGDNALEHVNRSMKVSGGLIGITLNPSARTKFFLVAPELAVLAEEAQHLAGVSSSTPSHHHELSGPVLERQEENVNKLTTTISSFTQPFAVDCEDLFNLATKAVMPEDVKHDLCRRNDIGKELFEKFMSQRITSRDVNLWAPMKKAQLKVWKSSAKTTRVQSGDKMMELKEDRSLFARMLVVSKSRPEINLKEAIGHHEFSVVPRSLFAADGMMLHCSKSALLKILEDCAHADASEENQQTNSFTLNRGVAIVDAMAELQALDKPECIKDCSDLAMHFSERILQKYSSEKYDEVHLVFDRYDIPMSLKTSTRTRRQGGIPPVAYHITASTNISRVPMKRLLSHVNTKHALSSFLSERIHEEATAKGMKFVVAWTNQCKATFKNVSHLASDQEEADTKLILHAYEASKCGASSIHIYSPDTDVLVLAIRRYPELCKDTCFITGMGQHKRTIHLGPIYHALTPSFADALPGFHAFTGADITGSFAGKGKLSCWKALQAADENVLSGFANLGTSAMPSDETLVALETYVCKLYLPNTLMTQIKDVRWWLFTKKQAQAESLPPTKDALHRAILRTHYQCMIWCNDIVAKPQIPSPTNYGWTLEDNMWKETMMTEPLAPAAVIHLVKCGCSKTKCTTKHCRCKRAALCCTELCSCSDMEEACDNSENQTTVYFDEEDSDDE